MNDKELYELARRPNMVRTARRTIGLGMTLFALYNIGFSAYSHYRQARFFDRAESMLDRVEGTSSAVHSSEGPSLLESMVVKIANAGKPCTRIVTVPAGGSLSSISEIYFADADRWKQDLPLNTHINDPNRIQPGTQYTFHTCR